MELWRQSLVRRNGVDVLTPLNNWGLKRSSFDIIFLPISKVVLHFDGLAGFCCSRLGHMSWTWRIFPSWSWFLKPKVIPHGRRYFTWHSRNCGVYGLSVCPFNLERKCN